MHWPLSSSIGGTNLVSPYLWRKGRTVLPAQLQWFLPEEAKRMRKIRKNGKSCSNLPILHSLEWSKKSARIMEQYIYINRDRLHITEMRWRLEHLLYYWAQKTYTNLSFGDPDPHFHGMVRILIFNGNTDQGSSVYRKFVLYIPRNETAQPSSRFLILVSVRDLYIPRMSAHLAAAK
jgi:hypothetical protein